MMRHTLLAVLALLVACARPHEAAVPDGATFELDVAYGEDPAQALDVYVPAGADGAPVVVYVHGGGWRIGDKEHVDDKANMFLKDGALFVSVNYRLSSGDAPVRHPAHVEDVARALAWVHANIAERGGDPSRISIIGHSAGAHLVALVSTDARWLAAHGLSRDVVRCVFANDTEALDIPTAMADASANQMLLFENAFGDDEQVWAGASPITHLAADAGIAQFLLTRRGSASRQAVLDGFLADLAAAEIPADVIDAQGLSHEEVNDVLGEPDDDVMTPPTRTFFADCFAG